MERWLTNANANVTYVTFVSNVAPLIIFNHSHLGIIMESIGINSENLTLSQAARECGVSRVTMWRWVKTSGLVSATTAGGHHRIRRKDLCDFIERKNMGHRIRSTDKRQKILVVDDDPHIQKYLIKVLTGKGYHVITGRDGFEAGILVMKFQPQLVVLDLYMPHIDGFQVCRHLKSDPDTAPIKILAISGMALEANIQHAKDCGADAFLEKPLDINRLLGLVESLLSKFAARAVA